MTTDTLVKVLPTVIAGAVSAVFGCAVTYGMFREQWKNMREELKLLRTGGDMGTTLYMSRPECYLFRDQCIASRCNDMKGIAKSVSDHEYEIRGLRNFAFWILTHKEGLPINEANEILGDRRKPE